MRNHSSIICLDMHVDIIRNIGIHTTKSVQGNHTLGDFFSYRIITAELSNRLPAVVQS